MKRENFQGGTVQLFAHFRRAGQTAQEGSAEEKIPVMQFKSPHAIVGITLGKMIYQGQYNSTDIRVSVSLPCYPEEVKEGLDEAQEIAHERIKSLMARIERNRTQ